MSQAFGVAAAICMVASIVICWLRIGKLMRRTTHCGPRWELVFSVYLPIAWAACLAGALLIPAIILFVSLVILSFGR
jgi:hypothetical protein